MKVRLYLADLTHVGNGIATEAFPLNIGLIASYLKKNYGNELEISLFKYPQDLKEAIFAQTPHILGCSNYSWNSNLAYYFCKFVKAIDSETLTVFGGQNYPFEALGQQKFLEARPAVDIHVFNEGEQAWVKIIERFISASNYQEIFKKTIESCQFIDRTTGEFVSGTILPRIRDLDSIPSPYSIGLLDKFFDGKLTPLVETARGCPFTCNFCNAGNSYFSKLNLFSDEYLREEWTYIAKRASETGVKHVTIADNNFGMLPRDATNAELLYNLREKNGWPESITAWTGKNSKERVIDATRLLGEVLHISMSVQSMNDIALKNIGRRNIRLDHYRAIAEELSQQGRSQIAEVIMPLPGETLEAHIAGMKTLLDTKVSRVVSHTLQMNHGTPYKDDEKYRQQYGYVTKYRVVPLDFSKIDDDCIFDVEEVAIASNTMSFEEYVKARQYLFVIDLCSSSDVFKPLKKYLFSRGLTNSQWVDSIYQQQDNFLPKAKQIFQSFAEETKSELWDSEEEIFNYYSQSDNYQKLINYEAGGNVLFKHRVRMLSEAGEDWVETVFACTRKLIFVGSDLHEQSSGNKELNTLKQYTLGIIADYLSPEGLEWVVEKDFEYDILSWLQDENETDLAIFKARQSIKLLFRFSPSVVTIVKDGLNRYGTDISALVKLIQRAGTNKTFMREVAIDRTTILPKAS